MATTTIVEVWPSIGSAWTRALALWSTWVQDNTKVITTGVGTTLSTRMLIVGWTTAGNTTNYNLVCSDIPGTNVLVPVPHILQSPGWRNMPGILANVYGTTTTLTAWSNQMLNLRATAIGTFCGITAPTWTTVDYTGDVTGLRIRHSITAVRKQLCYGADAACCGVVDGTLPAGTTVQQLPTDGLLAGSPVPGVVILDPTQYTGIVQAIQDVALQSIDYDINNGSAVFSVRGQIRTG